MLAVDIPIAIGPAPVDVVLLEGIPMRRTVVDREGRPLEGARVRAPGLASTSSGAAFIATYTGSDGVFELPFAGAVDVRFRIERQGYVSVEAESRSSRPAMPFVLERGEVLEGSVLDPDSQPLADAIVGTSHGVVTTDRAGRFRLADLKPGTAALFVTNLRGLAATQRVDVGTRREVVIRASQASPVAGVVRNPEDGKAIPHARLVVRCEQSDLGAVVWSGLANTSGEFTVPALGLDRYYLWVTAPGFSGVMKSVRPRQHRKSVMVVRLKRAIALTGRIVDEGGEPVPLAWIGWRGDSSVTKTGERGVLEPEPVVAQADGTFTMAVNRGLGWLAVTRMGFADATQEVTASALAGVPLSIILKPGLNVEGRVAGATTRPISGAQVLVSNADLKSLSRPESWVYARATATTDAGRFSVWDLGEGRYSAVVSADGYLPRVITDLRVGPNRLTHWPPFVLTRTAEVKGDVRDEGGNPVGGARVSVIDEEKARLEVQTDGGGEFRVGGLADGRTVTLLVTASNFAAERQTVTAPGVVSVVLAPLGSISGTITDADSGQPISSFTVGWRPAMTGVPTFEGQNHVDGTFLLRGVSPGDGVLVVQAPQHSDAEVTLRVLPGEQLSDIRVKVAAGLAVAGRVVDSEGLGVANALVDWVVDGAVPRGATPGAGRRASPTSEDGRFVLEGLPDGIVRVSARHEGYPATVGVLDTSIVQEIVLVLTPGAALSGVVTTREGAVSIGSVTISLVSLGSAIPALEALSVSTDAAGRFRAPDLRPGTYRVTARGVEGQTEPLNVVLAPGDERTDVKLVLRGGGRVDGKVMGLSPELLSVCVVDVTTGEWSARPRVADDGSFHVDNIPEGTADVYARDSMSGRSVAQRVEIAGEGTNAFVELEFDGDGRLSGRVVEGGEPISGARLVVASGAVEARSVQVMRFSGEGGEYDISGLREGRYALSVFWNGGLTTRDVDVSGETVLDIDLGGHSLTGVVKDSESGTPIGGCSVRAEEDSGTRIRVWQTASDGSYHFSNLPSGNYLLSAAADGYRRTSVQTLVDGQDGQQDIELIRGPAVRLKVRDRSGRVGLSSVVAVIEVPGSRVVFADVVGLDPSGVGYLPSLADGSYVLHVSADGFSTSRLSVTLPIDEVTVTLTASGQVVVRAFRAVVVRLLDSRGGRYLRAGGSLDGMDVVTPPLTILRGIEAGTYSLINVNDPDQKWSFTVGEGGTAHLEME